jgi:hypothetical protein
MNKRFELIHLNGQMYMVDGIPSLTGEWYIDDTDAIRQSVTDNTEYWLKREGYKKIVATKDPSLGLPLLPEIEEDISVEAVLEGQKVYTAWDRDDNSMTALGGYQRGYKVGYKAAKAKQYTEEDLRYAYNTGRMFGQWEAPNSTLESKPSTINELLQSLKPLPIAVEVEMESNPDNGNPAFGGYDVPDTIKIENGYVKVRRWIW